MNINLFENLCPICSRKISSLSKYPGSEPSNSSLQFKELGQCTDCQLGVALPAYNQCTLDLFYGSGEYWTMSGHSFAQVAHERNQSRQRVLFCQSSLVENVRVLDIGAGHGWIANAMSELKLNVSAYDFIEPDSANCKIILSRNLSFPVHRVISLENITNKYDFIFLNHVIEHVANPVIFLKSIMATLKTGGIIYIETPNMDHLFKKNVFPHTFFFSKKSLNKISNRLGLKVLEISSFGSKRAFHNSLWHKIIILFFDMVARDSVRSFEKNLDDFIWKYTQSTEDGIWVRLLARKESELFPPL